MKHLIEIIKTDNTIICEEAAKCLGEIGPLKCSNMSYSFNVDNGFYNILTEDTGVESFIKTLFLWMEKYFMNFDTAIYNFVINISENLVNFSKSKPFVTEFRYFKVFETKMKTSFDNVNSIKEVDFLKIIKNIENVEYSEWICNFVGDIFEKFQWKDLELLARRKHDFAENCFINVFRVLLDNKEKHMFSIVKLVSLYILQIVFIL